MNISQQNYKDEKQSTIANSKNQNAQKNKKIKFQTIVKRISWVFYLRNNCKTSKFQNQDQYHKNIVNKINDNAYIFQKQSFENKNITILQKIWKFIIPLKNLLKVYSPDEDLPLFIDFLTVMIILCDFFLIPLSLSFEEVQENKGLEKYQTFIICFFSFILCFSFNIAVYKKGQLYYDRKIIAQTYLKTYFLIDLVATIPFDQFISGESDGSTSLFKAFRFFRILRTLKLLQGQKLKNLMDQIEDYLINQNFIKVFLEFFKIFFVIITTAHWIACFFHYIRQIEIQNNESILFYSADSNLVGGSMSERYITCLYWAIQTMTTIGYGDIPIITQAEKLYVIFVMFLASGMYGYTLNKISSIILDMDNSTENYKNQTKAMNIFMLKKNLPKDFKQGVRQYFDFVFQENGQIDNVNKMEENILKYLSEGLMRDLIYQKNSKILNNIYFFNFFSDKFIKEICIRFKEQLLGQNEYLLDEENQDIQFFNQKLIYLIQGRIKFFNKKTDTNFNITSQKTLMGEIEFFTGFNNVASILTQDFTFVLQITRKEFNSLINSDDFQNDNDIYHIIRYEQSINNDHSKLKIVCFCCKQEGHYITNCPAIHYQVEKDKLFQSMTNIVINFANFNRFNVKFNSRALYKSIQNIDLEDETYDVNFLTKKKFYEQMREDAKKQYIEQQKLEKKKKNIEQIINDISNDKVMIYRKFNTHNNFDQLVQELYKQNKYPKISQNSIKDFYYKKQQQKIKEIENINSIYQEFKRIEDKKIQQRNFYTKSIFSNPHDENRDLNQMVQGQQNDLSQLMLALEYMGFEKVNSVLQSLN